MEMTFSGVMTVGIIIVAAYIVGMALGYFPKFW
jgi:hypothetical protein